MSISGGLSSALSGLTAASKAAEVVSNNIANATTPGYGRRVLNTSARVVGSVGMGVRIDGITRISNPIAIRDRRLAEAMVGDRFGRASFLQRVELALGRPDQAGSFSGRIAAFDSALVEAASRPESEARLSRVMETAKGMLQLLNTASRDIQASRATADDQITQQVAFLNSTLEQIAAVNVQIRENWGSGRETAGLMDERQQLVDSISSLLPLREVERENGQIALYAHDGTEVLGSKPGLFGFEPVGVITPDMTIGGALSGLTLNGRDIRTSGDRSPITGGSLAGQFAVRDELSVEAQAKLDAVARDLIERFQDAGLDATRAPGDPGLFTDDGFAFDAANELGLSQRISLNALVDPLQGGELWRLRDGLGAAAPGHSGDATLLNALQGALVQPRTPVSGGFMTGERSFATLGADLLSGISSARLQADGDVSFAQGHADTMRQIELQDGVDTDQEMQSLLMIEQSYAANAKVVQTIHELIDLLLGM
jgi:flagellar hook-associated protein 1 FlgK